GAAAGGKGGSGGNTSGGSAAGGGGAGTAGSAGNAGSAGSGGATSGWSCPPASTFTGSPLPAALAAEQIAGAPPSDAFNNTSNDYTTVEGPVWIGDSLYFSELKGGNLPQARILKLAADNSVSVAIADAGANGLATDGAGNIVSANH